jgi:hypothetical protein
MRLPGVLPGPGRNPVLAMPRGNDYTSEADVMTLFQRQNGICSTPGCDTLLQLNRPRNFQIEHETALGRKGSNDLSNKSLRCVPCAKRKTFGNGATSKGSDLYEIASERRIIRTGKMIVNKPPTGEKREPKPKFKRQFPKGRKMQSRKFRRAK